MKLLCRMLALVLALMVSPVLAQTSPGTSPLSVPKGGTGAASLTDHGFILGHGAGPFTSLLCGAAQLAVGQSAANPICQTISGDVTINASGVTAIGSGVVSMAKIATGTQDTVIGYWGSTTASAIAVNNCSNALTYSTSTHTFGCNTTAGTGTVTSVATAGLATGGPITASGTVTVTDATQSDMETGSSTTTAVVPGRQQHHKSAAKVFVSISSCSSSPCTILSSYNVNSVTRSTTGTYAVNFTTAFSTNTYACVSVLTTSGLSVRPDGSTKATGSIGVVASNTSFSLADAGFDLVCFGDQ
jgi:hypothetical protein